MAVIISEQSNQATLWAKQHYLLKSRNRAHMKTNDHANQTLIFSPNKFEWHSSSRLGAAKFFSKGDTQSKVFSQLNICEHKIMGNEIDKTEQELKKLSGKTSFHEWWTKCQLVGRAVSFCVFNETSSTKKVNHIPVIWERKQRNQRKNRVEWTY